MSHTMQCGICGKECASSGMLACDSCAADILLHQSDDDWEAFDMCHDIDAFECTRCGGEGWLEYNDCPEAWGEDCPSEVNHLVDCPECDEIEVDRNRAFVRFVVERKQKVTP